MTTVAAGLVVVAVLAACLAARPSDRRTVERSAARRRRFVEQHPAHVNSQDIRSSLVRDGVAPDQAWSITEKAAEHGVRPFTMWLWLQQLDADALAIVVAADVSYRDLLAHISNGTVPDLEELRLSASANGLVIAGPPVRTPRRKVLVDSTRSAPPHAAAPGPRTRQLARPPRGAPPPTRWRRPRRLIPIGPDRWCRAVGLSSAWTDEAGAGPTKLHRPSRRSIGPGAAQ